jgi:hypothetical protein
LRSTKDTKGEKLKDWIELRNRHEFDHESNLRELSSQNDCQTLTFEWKREI